MKKIACLGAMMVALAAMAEVVPSYDVIVAGGGPAGIGAGYVAASRGARTLVLEKSGFGGGTCGTGSGDPRGYRRTNRGPLEAGRRGSRGSGGPENGG